MVIGACEPVWCIHLKQKERQALLPVARTTASFSVAVVNVFARTLVPTGYSYFPNSRVASSSADDRVGVHVCILGTFER